MKQQQVKVIWNHTENAQQMIFCEHWYYSQASYEGDHELLGDQPFEEGEGRDVNNDNSGACCKTDQSSLFNRSEKVR